MNTALLAMMLVGQSGIDQTKVIYQPGVSIKDQLITLRSWGSGIVTETQEAAFGGTTSIRVTTKNLFQGGTVEFGKTVDLVPFFADKANLLRVTFKPFEGVSGGGGAAPSGGRGGGGGRGGNVGPGAGGPGAGGPGGDGGGGGAAPGAFGPGGPGGQGGPSGGFGAGGPQGGPGGRGPGGVGPQGGGPSSSANPATLKTIRVIITTTDGKKSEASIPASTSVSVEGGWRQAGIPLQAIAGFDKTNKVVKSISFAGNTSTAFYVGDLRVVSDRTPIKGEPSFRSVTISKNNQLTFSAVGYGGSSVLKYTWDFDDADGIQEDAEGQSVRYRFRSASNDLDPRNTKEFRPGGAFVVTLTISDVYGLKEPYSTQIKVKVNP